MRMLKSPQSPASAGPEQGMLNQLNVCIFIHDFSFLIGDLKGSYHHLVDLSPEERYRLPDILQSVTDAPVSRTLISSGSTRDWPCGRGVFYSKSCDLFAWTNREDHLRIMYRDRDMDIVTAFKT